MGEWVRDHLIVLFILYYSKQNVCGIGCVRNKRKIFFPAVNCCLFFFFVSGCVYAEDLFPDTLMPCFFFFSEQGTHLYTTILPPPLARITTSRYQLPSQFKDRDNQPTNCHVTVQEID